MFGLFVFVDKRLKDIIWIDNEIVYLYFKNL